MGNIILSYLLFPVFLGYGVITRQEVPSGEFLCFYPGDVLTEDAFEKHVAEGRRLEEENYVYTFVYQGQRYW